MGTKGHLLQRTSPKFRYSTLSCLRSNDPRLVKCLVHNERSVVFKKDKVKQQAIPLNSKPRFQTSRIVYKSSLSSSMCREHQVYRTDGCGRCSEAHGSRHSCGCATTPYLRAHGQNGITVKVNL